MPSVAVVPPLYRIPQFERVPKMVPEKRKRLVEINGAKIDSITILM